MGIGRPLPARGEKVGQLLATARLEVIPTDRLSDEIARLSHPEVIAVTCSPVQGVAATLAATRYIAGAGHRPIPHIAARSLRSREELVRIMDELRDLDVQDIFVVGGDQSPPMGPYVAAADVLEVLGRAAWRPERIGVGAYPEGHPKIDDARLEAALAIKRSLADYVVTQICFDLRAVDRWLTRLRETGFEMPVLLGLPGAVERARLVRISAQIGVGLSLRQLTKRRDLTRRLVKARNYTPEELIDALDADDRLREMIAGLQLSTFNQIDQTIAWRDRHASIAPLPEVPI